MKSNYSPPYVKLNLYYLIYILWAIINNITQTQTGIRVEKKTSSLILLIKSNLDLFRCKSTFNKTLSLIIKSH